MVNSPRKKLLLVCRRAPYGNTLARAGLDVALAAAAFEQDIALLFMDEGIWQLLPAQEAGAIDSKNLGATLDSMPLYDLDTFHVCAESLRKRQLEHSDLAGNIAPLERAELAHFIDSHDHILSF